MFEIRVVNNASVPLSLKFEKSDYISNQMILNNLIATLVKYDNSGNLVPFLSQGWTIENNGLLWKFIIKPNYRDQAEVLISSQRFAEDLLETFKFLRNRNESFWGESLVGWQDYKSFKEDHVSGLSWDDESILFNFESQPDQFLNFLRMPYFGYWGSNRMSDEQSFVSSGPYKLHSANPSLIILELRDCYQKEKNQLNFVMFSQGEVSDCDFREKQFMAISKSMDAMAYPSDLKKIAMPPDGLSVVVLNRTSIEKFLDAHSYKIFVNDLRNDLLKVRKSDEDFRTTSFYGLNIEDVGHHSEVDLSKFKPKRPLKILVSSTWEKEIVNSAESLVISILERNSWAFKIYSLEDMDKHQMEFSDFDIRFVSVIAGQKFNSAVVEMMFCSKLGVNFPDPGGRVEKILSEVDWSDENKETALNELLFEEGSLIPYLRFGLVWTFAEKVNFEKDPGPAPYLALHLLRVKDS
ncbi:MAG TPA: hypothetical protein DCL41_03845 [Bdellovibrionales bacterium]|nr:hypothetical protein [Bdellovibrionales bacterium]